MLVIGSIHLRKPTVCLVPLELETLRYTQHTRRNKNINMTLYEYYIVFSTFLCINLKQELFFLIMVLAVRLPDTFYYYLEILLDDTYNQFETQLWLPIFTSTQKECIQFYQ